VKSIVELIIFVAYIQLSGEFDLIGEVKKRLLHR
jgi:hypothetical protein